MKEVQTKRGFASPKVIVGPVGSGKSTVLSQQSVAAAQSGRSVFLFTDNHELIESISTSKSLKQISSYQVWDFSDPTVMNQFALTLNTDQQSEKAISMLDLASRVDHLYHMYVSILQNFGEHSLDEQSKTLLAATCKVIFAHPNQTFYDVYQFLSDSEARKAYLEGVSLKDYPLLDKNELELLADLSEFPQRTFGSTGALLKRFSPILRDFRVKTFLSNKPSHSYQLSQLFKPGNLTLFYFPRLKYTADVYDCLTSLLTLNLQLIQETQSLPFTPMSLVYEDSFQLPHTLKALNHSLSSFAYSNIELITTIFDYVNARKFLDALSPYQPEFIFLTKPSSFTLTRLDLGHLKGAIEALNWRPFQALHLCEHTTQVELRNIQRL